jgi:hypothetical protein
MFRRYVPRDKRKNILSIERWEREHISKIGLKVLILFRIDMFPNGNVSREHIFLGTYLFLREHIFLGLATGLVASD